ncbi:hypothetical protein [Methylibium petroleiphilum]|uniref:Uncharacterized protein n=1 Tax=Methylibium petroleiphilum (strain ATCC BAA-1232 / LMG 22953 / PM1) TaxID=420662 RepID=A2SML3_METPP|nr:hypothetical protein [Methylibium petroleiphilum]ABM96802.1 hypothetical protein Mpe_B0021 [Methylibium petroleiphilum PM1]
MLDVSVLSDIIHTAGSSSPDIHARLQFYDLRRMANTVENRGVDAPAGRLPVDPAFTVWGRTGATTTFALPAGAFKVNEHGILHGDFPCPIAHVGAPCPPNATHLLIEVHANEMRLRYVLGEDEAPLENPGSLPAVETPRELARWAPIHHPRPPLPAPARFLTVIKQLATYAALLAAAWLAYGMGQLEDKRNVRALKDAAAAAAESLADAKAE